MSGKENEKIDKGFHTKYSFFKVLYVLMKYSDEDHPLSQAEIKKKVDKKFEEDMNEKTIPDALKAIDKTCNNNLEMFGEYCHGDKSDKSGKKEKWYINNYIKHVFEDHELRLLIDMVSAADYMDLQERKNLLKKIYSLSSDYFKKDYTSHIFNYVPAGNIKRAEILCNVKSIHNGIRHKHKIRFNYLKRSVKGILELRTDDNGKTKEYEVSPYRTIFNDGFYYLICWRDDRERLDHFRIDRMIFVDETEDKAVPEGSVIDNHDGSGLSRYISNHRMMWSGKAERVTFRCPKWAINEVADYFGDDFSVLRTEQVESEGETVEMLVIKVYSSPESMKYWAYRFMDFVEVTSPKSLRDELREMLKKRYTVYCD